MLSPFCYIFNVKNCRVPETRFLAQDEKEFTGRYAIKEDFPLCVVIGGMSAGNMEIATAIAKQKMQDYPTAEIEFVTRYAVNAVVNNF